MMCRLLLFLTLSVGLVASAEDLTQAVADRSAIEHVYYNHRLGEKLPFELTLTSKALEELVQADQHKETVLRQVFHFEVTPAMVDAEAKRIEATTRAPEILAELKAALGNDPLRFARTVVRPVVVDRELRARFESDEQIQLPVRHKADEARNGLLAVRGRGLDEQIALLMRNYSSELVTNNWLLARPPGEPDSQKSFFTDLPAELQNVLHVQLQNAGDVSAVIEMPQTFMVCVLMKKSDASLQVAALNFRKITYDKWLRER